MFTLEEAVKQTCLTLNKISFPVASGNIRSIRKTEILFDGSHLNERTSIMISWALTFLIIAIIAGVLGLSGVAGMATNIAWILFVVGLILAVLFGVLGRRPPV